ncbi:ABC transporter substrate-binding protein [Saccharothrix xinjiangensis]|uniref:ABC transporter substrate-binding protein n=1 Tax=Saccharothrix xinjiangensis TaxID=204798 RepID=A0ABV9Y9S8_9PSEU
MRLFAALTLLLAACAGCSGVPDGPTDDEGPITFVDGRDTSSGRQVHRLVERWNDANPLETVKFLEMSNSTDIHRAQLMTRAQDLAGVREGYEDRCYDVMNLDTVWTSAFAESGHLVPLPAGEFGADRMLPQVVDQLRVGHDEGRLWAVPWRVDAGFLFYRRDVLEAEGEDPPRTWAELRRLAVEVAPKHGLAGYVGQFADYEGLVVNAVEAIWANGGDPLRPDRSEAKAGVEFLARGFEQGWIPPEATDYREEESREVFQAGKALFMRNWPYVRPLLEGPRSAVAGDWGVVALPGPSALGGWNLAVSRCSTHQRTAREFIRFLTREQTQGELFRDAGWAPSLAGLYPAGGAALPWESLLGEAVRTALPRPTSAYYDELTSVMRERLRLSLAEPSAIDGLMDDLAERVQEVREGR